MTPRLAICLPSAPTPAGYEMVRRSVAALRAQDCDPSLFEVVVAIDGGEFDGIDHHHPFPMRVVTSPRPHGNIPHRNHSRNAAWRAASAPLCWMLDADFILPPHAIRHVLAEHDAAMARGVPAVLSPCLWQFGGASTEQWWERSAGWAESGDPAEFREMLASWPEWDRGTFSGFGELATDPATPASVSVGARMVEGMPILWRSFLEAHPFDESYVGWGGDKISLVDVLKGLCREGVVDIRVVTSVVAVHQPHATDPTHTDARSKANEKRRGLARMEIESRTLGWKRRMPGLVAALRRGWAAASTGTVPEFGAAPEIGAVIDALLPMIRRRWKPGAFVVPIGAHAATVGVQVERAGLPVRFDGAQTPHAVAVLVDPIAGDWIAGTDALGRKLRAELHTSAAVVIAQRLDGPGLDGLQPTHIQTQVIKRSMDARTIKSGGVRFTLICGRL